MRDGINSLSRRPPFYVGLAAGFLFLLTFIYLHLYLKYVRKQEFLYDQWQIQAPIAIPIATACMLSSGFCFTLAFWPIWHIWTIPVLFLEFLGFVCVLSLFG